MREPRACAVCAKEGHIASAIFKWSNRPPDGRCREHRLVPSWLPKTKYRGTGMNFSAMDYQRPNRERQAKRDARQGKGAGSV